MDKNVFGRLTEINKLPYKNSEDIKKVKIAIKKLNVVVAEIIKTIPSESKAIIKQKLKEFKS